MVNKQLTTPPLRSQHGHGTCKKRLPYFKVELEENKDVLNGSVKFVVWTLESSRNGCNVVKFIVVRS